MDFLEAGRIAYEAGRDREAYDLWKRGVIQQPKSEALWTALYDVVSTAEDRRTCLENILQINPKNDWARSTLRAFDLIEAQIAPGKRQTTPLPRQKSRPRIVPRLVRWLLIFVIIVSVLLFAVTVQILLTLPT